MHSPFAALFDLLFIYFIHFKSQTLSVNPAAPPPRLEYFYKLQDICSSYFLNGLICFLGMFPEPDSFLPVLEWMARPLTLMPNQRPACFSAPFWQPPLFPRDCQSFRVYSMLQCQFLWERCDLHTVVPQPPPPPPFCLFWKKKHTVETFPLHGSWIAFANFYDELLWSLLILLLSVVLLNICCTALTATWRVVLLSLYDT